MRGIKDQTITLQWFVQTILHEAKCHGHLPLLKDIRINAPIERGSVCRLIHVLSPAPATGLIYCFRELQDAEPTLYTHTHTHKPFYFLSFLTYTYKMLRMSNNNLFYVDFN